MEKYPMINREGGEESPRFGRVLVCHQLGEYQVYWEPRDDQGDTGFYVLCHPDARKIGCYNWTFFYLQPDNNLDPIDNDVELDPYHMCLLYQLLEQVTRDV